MASCKMILTVLLVANFWDAALLQDSSLPYAFTSTAQEKKVLEGDDVVFECAFDSKVFTVMWQNNTVPFSMNRDLLWENSRVSIEGTNNVYNLRIRAVTSMDQGSWECIVPSATTIKQINQLIVLIAPTISALPTDDEVEQLEGQPLKLSCYADGNPEPEVKWTREGENLPDGNASFIGETFELTAIKRQDGGTYTCSASNEVDPDAKEMFDVEVVWPPNVTVDESLIYSGPGESVELECEFDANPAVQVIWMLNRQDLNLEQRTNIESKTDGEGTHILEISDLQEADFGEYTCKGGNSRGEKEGTIVVSGLPHSIEFVSNPQSKYSDQYELTWDLVSIATPIDCDLNIHETDDGPFSGDNVVPSVVDEGRQHRQSYLVLGLTKNTTYHAKVKCRNDLGMSEWTEEFSFYTSAEERPGPPPPTTVEVPTERPTTTVPPVKSTELVIEEVTTMAEVLDQASTQPAGAFAVTSTVHQLPAEVVVDVTTQAPDSVYTTGAPAGAVGKEDDGDLTTAATADVDDDSAEDDDDAAAGDDDDDDDDKDAGDGEDVKDNGNTANSLQAWASSLVTMATALYLCHLRQ